MHKVERVDLQIGSVVPVGAQAVPNARYHDVEVPRQTPGQRHHELGQQREAALPGLDAAVS